MFFCKKLRSDILCELFAKQMIPMESQALFSLKIQEYILECLLLKFFMVVNSFPGSGYFCHLLITFANSLDQDQADLIWIQTVWHADIIPERFFW